MFKSFKDNSRITQIALPKIIEIMCDKAIANKSFGSQQIDILYRFSESDYYELLGEKYVLTDMSENELSLFIGTEILLALASGDGNIVYFQELAANLEDTSSPLAKKIHQVILLSVEDLKQERSVDLG